MLLKEKYRSPQPHHNLIRNKACDLYYTNKSVGNLILCVYKRNLLYLILIESMFLERYWLLFILVFMLLICSTSWFANQDRCQLHSLPVFRYFQYANNSINWENNRMSSGQCNSAHFYIQHLT